MKRAIKRSFWAIGLFLFFSWTLPHELPAQKETPPSPENKPKASYYDFDDILIPAELTLDRKNSFFYGTSQSKVGHLIFEGRVEPSSLTAFFLSNMQKDGWNLINTFKHRDYLLSFLKEERACVITISEKSLSTTVEVRVGPIEKAAVKGTLPP